MKSKLFLLLFVITAVISRGQNCLEVNKTDEFTNQKIKETKLQTFATSSVLERYQWRHSISFRQVDSSLYLIFTIQGQIGGGNVYAAYFKFKNDSLISLKNYEEDTQFTTDNVFVSNSGKTTKFKIDKQLLSYFSNTDIDKLRVTWETEQNADFNLSGKAKKIKETAACLYSALD